mmetsp:Transcript_45407/g.60285  ORF Transcript_45407/g.60285 Transcript_45407/m.60285 type:complete len:98 (+) Transcript_45407:215-508(+)
MDLKPARLFVPGVVGVLREVSQVELDVVPVAVEAEWQGADEGLDARLRLVSRRPEPPPRLLFIHDLHFERKVIPCRFEGKCEAWVFDAEGLGGINWA